MIPQENAVRHRPMSVLLASATPRTSCPSAATTGRGCEPLCVLGGRGVRSEGRGVCVIRGAGGTVGAGAVPAGGVILTPTFILKLLFPRYTTLSFSPPGTSSATTTSFLSSLFVALV